MRRTRPENDLDDPNDPDNPKNEQAAAMTEAAPKPGTARVFVRDLVLRVSIGVHDFEHKAPQPVRFNIDLAVDEAAAPGRDVLSDAVNYEKIVNGVRAVIAEGHVQLVETMAERVAAMALAADARVRSVRVRVEKLEIVAEAAAVGVEIERTRP
ncbi:MAG: dihydroneopterin aldolase [Rhodospirillales bacterium]